MATIKQLVTVKGYGIAVQGSHKSYPPFVVQPGKQKGCVTACYKFPDGGSDVCQVDDSMYDDYEVVDGSENRNQG